MNTKQLAESRQFQPTTIPNFTAVYSRTSTVTSWTDCGFSFLILKILSIPNWLQQKLQEEADDVLNNCTLRLLTSVIIVNAVASQEMNLWNDNDNGDDRDDGDEESAICALSERSWNISS